jgi:hypothetical protein
VGMTHDELLAKLADDYQFADYAELRDEQGFLPTHQALRAVVELHKPSPIPDWVPTKEELMCWCAHIYPCPTVQAIEKELE